MGNFDSKSIWSPIAGGIMIAQALGLLKQSDIVFRTEVKQKGLTDPKEIWDACCAYHEKLQSELIEARAKIEHAQNLIRIAEGISNTQRMMKEQDVPDVVKSSIVSHWWTELMQQFVEWGIVLPGEIDTSNTEYFRLAGIMDPGRREAELRSHAYAWQKRYELLKRDFDLLIGEINKHVESAPYTERSRPKNNDFAFIQVRADLVREALDKAIRENNQEDLARLKDFDKKWVEELRPKADPEDEVE